MTTHLHLVPSLRMSGVKHLLPCMPPRRRQDNIYHTSCIRQFTDRRCTAGSGLSHGDKVSGQQGNGEKFRRGSI